jgi:aldehyde:ferredoxin oxidoreductase
LTTEPAPDGLGKGNVANVDIMLDEFYDSMGWDKKTGVPTEDKLKELNLI